MLHFTMHMPFYLMAFYGSILIILVLFLRGLLKNKLPGFVFPVLWGVILLRLLVPFSLSSPLTLKVPKLLSLLPTDTVVSSVEEDTAVLASGTGFGSREDNVLPESARQTELTPDSPPLVKLPLIDQVVENSANIAYSYAYADNGGFFFLNWRLLVSILYFLGLAVTAGILGVQKYQAMRRLKDRLLVEQNETINSILRDMHMGHILVFTSDALASPMVCGLWNPAIYLPTRMDFNDTMLLRHILTHEVTHIRRRDNWTKLVMLAALCIHWFNPLVWIMAKCLSSDLENACDAAVLKGYDEEQRKSYAFSLLAMAITGNRTTLLYSAFSKTEVEKRIKNVVGYKKASVFVVAVSVLFLTCSTVVFATGGQAPFSADLTASCSSNESRWGMKVLLTRDIALGENPQKRAEDVIFDVLEADTSNDSAILEDAVKAALAKEFGVEKDAFLPQLFLFLDPLEKEKEYAQWEITEGEDGFHCYQGETVRVFVDETGGYYQSRTEGSVDVFVQRDSCGYITSLNVLRQGDEEYDRRSREIRQDRVIYDSYAFPSAETAVTETTVAESVATKGFAGFHW